MRKKITLKSAIKILKDTFQGFIDDRALKFSASLSYYTIFSLAPLLLLLISLAGLFLGRDAIQGHLFDEINGFIGNEAALKIQEIIGNMEVSGNTPFALAIGGFVLLLGATTVFAEIQDSINIIWKLKPKPDQGWLKLIWNRLLSSSIIVGLGFLLVVSLIINGVVLVLNDWLRSFFPEITLLLFQVINVALTFTVISTLFAVIFKVLPDARIAWKDVRAGAFFTACLFMLGRFLIGLYIQLSSTGSAYGAAGSVIVILVWVYYSAAILYFGAEFTKVYSEFNGTKIEPAEYAVYSEEKLKEER